jgi:SOS-response transcriptional repressor LexA
MKPPTEHQRAVLREIQNLTTRWGYPPTVRELCEAFAVASTNAMQETIGYLINKNCLRRASKLARSLTLTEVGKTFL